MGWLEVLLKRHLWILHTVVVGLCALFLGKALAHVVEAEYLVTDGVVPRRLARRPTPPARDKDATRILDRSIFCSRCAALGAAKEAEKAAAVPSGPQKSALPLTLGSVVLSSDEAVSIAVIRDMAKPRPPARWFHRGDTVFATSATVLRIAERRVYLQNGEAVEFLDLNEPVPVVASGPSAKGPAAPAPADGLKAEIDQGVRCSGAACEVDRSLVNHVLANTSLLASAARFVPAMQAGRPNGFRVYAIRRGSLFEKIGMQNGDRIVSINALPMSTPDEALQIYTKLRSASHLTVQLDRKGQTTTLDYTIR